MNHHLKSVVLTAALMMASWYSYIGKTANGERFDGTGYTAAHMTLPFGTLVKVERVSDSRFVIVRINDRGPFVKGRVIDLSREAFEAIGLLGEGIVQVKITVLDKEGSPNR
jgi:rare lipoprotein A